MKDLRGSLIQVLFLALVVGFASACTQNSDQPASPEEAASRLLARGRSTYMTQCASCHNADPSRDGSLGPALTGSSRELIEARLLKATYPSGYTPKRATKTMPAMPYLKNEIESLTLFLNSPSR